MKKLMPLIVMILLFSGCSNSNIKIITPSDNYRSEKITLNLKDNQIITSINPNKIDKYLKLVQPNELFDINQICISSNYNILNVAMIYNDIYISAIDKTENKSGIYKLVDNSPVLIYASKSMNFLKLIEKDGKLFFVEKIENTIVLKSLSIKEKSIKILFKIENSDFYNLYDCGNYIALATEKIDSYIVNFLDADNNAFSSKINLKKNNILIDIKLVANNVFAYRDMQTNSLCFYNIDNERIGSTINLDTLVTHDYLICKIVKDNIIVRDGDGISVYNFPQDQTTEIFYDLSAIEKNTVDLIDNTALYFINDDSFFACDYIKGKKAKLFTGNEKFYSYSNNVDTFILLSDNNSKIEIYSKKKL